MPVNDDDAARPLDLKRYIRDIPDFPRPGVLFKDITPLLGDAAAFQAAVDALTDQYAGQGVELVAAAEARGFMFGAPLALQLGVGFVPIRKPGKLPYRTVAMEYALEYGTDRLEIHCDALAPGRRVLLMDDVLATGGTMKACCDLVRQAGAEIIACAFVVELAFLEGRKLLEPYPVTNLIAYP